MSILVIAVLLLTSIAIATISLTFPSAYAISPQGNKPGKVEDLTLVFSWTQVTLTWGEPDDNGSPIIGYKIEQQEPHNPIDPGFSDVITNTGNTNPFFVITGLNPSTTYNFKVSAINTIGVGPPSNERGGTTLAPTRSITIIKDTIPEDPQDFDFTTIGTGIRSFSLDDDDDDTLSNTQTFTGLGLRTYTITEDAVNGFVVTDITCTDNGATITKDIPNRTVKIKLNGHDTPVCTFTNTQQQQGTGTIIVEKQTDPDGAAGSFTFTGDAADTISDGQQIVVSNLAAGTYTSTEDDPTPGFVLTDITCDDGNSTGNVNNRRATFRVEEGETVKCTFTNTQLPSGAGTIVIIKDTIPDNFQDFGFTTTGTGLSSFSLDDDADSTLSNTKIFAGIAADSYTVTEIEVEGWNLTDISCVDPDEDSTTDSPTAFIDLDAGETVTCTFENTTTASIQLSATAISQRIINLSWIDNTSSTCTLEGYDIFRMGPDDDVFIFLNFVDADTTNYPDTNLDADTLYKYQVFGIFDDECSPEESNIAAATTFRFLNGGLSYDITPPTTNGIRFSSTQDGTENLGFGGRLASYSNDIPTQIMQTGVEQRLQVSVSDNNGIAAIKRVVINFFFDYNLIQKSDTYFMYIEGEGLTVSDPFEIFGDVKVHRTFTNTEMILTFIFTPQKPLGVTDLVINGEDQYQNNMNTIIFGAFEIQGPPVVSVNVYALPVQVPYYKNPEWNQFVVDSGGNMISYDSFGNLYTKSVRVMDESVHYGDYIGRSERHDESFDDKVSAEEDKARQVASAIMEHPIYSGEQKTFKTDKVFKYPSNVGKGDRSDVKSTKELKQKETAKAQKHK